MAESSRPRNVLCDLLYVHGLGWILYSIHKLDPYHHNTIDNLFDLGINGYFQLRQRRPSDVGPCSLRAGSSSRALHPGCFDELHLRWVLLVHVEGRATRDS